MSKRTPVSKSSSKSLFRATARPHKRNLRAGSTRGGDRY